MTTQEAQSTFLFDFIKSVMIEEQTTIFTDEILKEAYRRTVKFLADDNNINLLKQAVKNII